MKQAWCLGVVALVVLACGAVAMGSETVTGDLASVLDYTLTDKFDVYHWWTAGGEKEAVDAALNVFEQVYTGLDAVSNAIPGGAGGAMVMKVKVLVATNNSPETFQAHPGYEIDPYTDSDMLYSLNDLWAYDNLEARMLPGVAAWCRTGDDYFVVPVGLHRTNYIWYNIALFNELGVALPQEPMTWDAFWALCDELQTKLPPGKSVLDLGDRMSWPATHVFETLMMGFSPQLYEDFVNGMASESQVQEVLALFKKFLSYVAADHTARLWYEAAGSLCSGDVAMYLQGSWIQAYFNSRGWVYGRDFGAFACPGTSGTFGLAVDAFVVPKGSQNPEDGLRWVHMCSSTALQEAFCPLKGAISPYGDTSPAVYDPLTLSFYSELMSGATLVYPSFTHGTALPWDILMDLHSRLSDFATSSDPDPARYARMIVDAMREAGVVARWDFVR